MPPHDWADGGSADVFSNREYGFSTVGVGAILGNGCGIQGQNYVALLQGSERVAGFHRRSWILCVLCYRLTYVGESQWCSDQISRVPFQQPNIVSRKGKI